jgi:hypothetical protein
MELMTAAQHKAPHGPRTFLEQIRRKPEALALLAAGAARSKAEPGNLM